MNNAAIQNNGRANPLAERFYSPTGKMKLCSDRGFWERTMNVNMWGVINGCQGSMFWHVDVRNIYASTSFRIFVFMPNLSCSL